MVPDENGSPTLSPAFPTQVREISGRGTTVGLEGHNITLSDITLQGKYTFSCNSVTNEIDTFIDNSAADCMDVRVIAFLVRGIRA